MASVNPRIAPRTLYILYMEAAATPGEDTGITTGSVMPIRDKVGYTITRPEVEVPYYNGTMQGFGHAPGPIGAEGGFPCSLDLSWIGNALKMPFGAIGYSKVALVTGYMHSFWPSATYGAPLSAQVQEEMTETTAIYERAKYNRLRSLSFAYAQGGAAPLDLDFVGNGDVAFTDLAGTKTENGVGAGISVYNGIARLAPSALVPTWLTLGGITNFRAAINTGANAVQVAFNDGKAGAVVAGVPQLTGSLELLKEIGGAGAGADFTFLNYAINRTLMAFDCEWADAAVAVSPYPTKWLRMCIATMRFNRKSTPGGGQAVLSDAQDFAHDLDATLSKIAAESFGTVAGPYAITGATNDVVSHNIDGLGASSVTLTAGAARTATQICTDLNANATFTARAVADVHNGRVRITSKQTGGTGASSSVALTAAAANANATLGFNTTSITGFNAPYVFRLYNTISADYPQ